MDFEEFWEKLQHIEQIEPPKLTKSNETYLSTKDTFFLISENYTDPVWFETLSGNKLFGVSNRKPGILPKFESNNAFTSASIDHGFLGVIPPTAVIKIFRSSGEETMIAKRHFKKIWDLAKNYDEPFKPKSYGEKTVSYDYYKIDHSDGITSEQVISKSAPDAKLEAKGWKMKKNVKKPAPGSLSYILPIMKHLVGDEIIE